MHRRRRSWSAFTPTWPATVPAEIEKAALFGRRPAAGRALADDERHAYEQLVSFGKHLGYAIMMGTRPQTLTGFADSPVGLAAFMIDHDDRSYELIARVFDGRSEGLTRDDILDNITLYWLTNTAISVGSPLLGKQARLLRSEERRDPGRGERLPGRALSGPAELGGAGVPEAHVLQEARQGRTLRCLGTAEGPFRGYSRGPEVGAHDDAVAAHAETGRGTPSFGYVSMVRAKKGAACAAPQHCSIGPLRRGP